MLARRDVLKTLAAAPAAGLPLAAVLADPRLARAAAHALETINITDGLGKSVSAALAMPATTPAPSVIVIHEWWGLNDQMKAYAAELAHQGYVALAIDLMDGEVATTPDKAGAQMQAVKADEANATSGAWVDWLKAHAATTDKIGTVGFCFGGSWSLNASLVRPVDATVVYYGDVKKSADDLAPLAGPVLGHFATKDQWITKPMVDGFLAAAQAANKDVTAHWYEADHAFANPSSNLYDEPDAKSAHDRTLAFYTQYLS